MKRWISRTEWPAEHPLKFTQAYVTGTVVAAALFVSGMASVAQAHDLEPTVAARGAVLLEKLPLDFVENRGQWSAPAKFVARKGSLAASFERDGIKLQLGEGESASLNFTFEGAATETVLVGEDRRSGQYNFFLGDDPAKWHANVAAYSSVRYRGLYKGIDVRVREQTGQLEYELLLAPGANLEKAVIRAEGALGLELADDGALIVNTSAGPLRQTPPVTWEQLPGGDKRPIESRFRIIDAQRYGFEVPGRDRNLALVIDPGLEWSTFLGGSNREEIHGLALTRDGSGDVVVAGHTFSSDFPTAPAGSLGSSPLIAFVARLNSAGTGLVYATLFGGTNGNVSYGFGLTLDASSAPIVVGETNAANFPTTPGAYRATFNEPSASINRGWDGFVTRFDASGNQMVFSTFLGAAPIFDSTRPGSKRGGDESARAVVVDGADNVIVSGYTTSENFPTTAGAYDRTHANLSVAVDLGTIESRTDAFISRLSPNGTQLTYSTYLGGQSDDIVKDMVIDAQGILTLVGIEAPLETFDGQGNRTDHGIPFPTTPDAVAQTHLGASDTFVARLSLDGTGAGDLKYSTILGAFYIDEATSVTLDPNNPELVTLSGYTRSWDFPTTPGAWRRAALFLADGHPYYSGYLMRFRFPAAGGGSLVWSTLITGTGTGQFADSVVVDTSGDVIVVGSDIAGSFPTTDRSYKRLPAKGSFLSRFSGDGTTLLYSTLLHQPSGVLLLRTKAVSSGTHAVIVAGSTLLTDFPTSPGAFDRVFGSNGTGDGFHTYDGFVAKLTLDPNTSSDTTAAAPPLVSPANGATIPLNGALTLDWTDVPDASGVQFYEVEVSANADFLAGFTFWNLAAGSYTSSQSTGSTSQEGVHYWRVRTLDGVNNFSPWSEVRKFTVGAPTWTNFAATSLAPNGVVGGSTVQGKVHIQNAAPAGGQVYTLTSSQPSVASAPASVTIPAGASSATFTVTTQNVSVSTPVQFTVWSEGNGDHPVLWVDPETPGAVTPWSVALNPTTVTGGSSSTGTVVLNNPAPAGGAVVTLSSSNTSVATVPASGSVTVPTGSTSATFTVSTVTVTAQSSAMITASFGGVTRTATLTVNPGSGGGVTLSSLAISPSSVTGGSPSTGTANLSGAAPSGGAVVTLSDNSSAASVPASVTVSAGATSANFTVTTTSVTSSTSATITGSLGGVSRTATLTVTPASGGTPAAPSLLSPANDATLAQPVSFDWSDVSAAASYRIQIDDSSNFSAPRVVDQTLAVSQFTASTLANRQHWWRVRGVNSAGTAGAWSSVRRFTPQAAPVAASLSALSVSPSNVVGPTSSTGTATLTAAAPSGGALVTLSSSNSAVASTPASVTVPAGATSTTFTVTTTAVSTSTAVTLTGSYSGVSRTSTLTVTPVPPSASLNSLTLSPSSVTGGGTSQGTVTLTSAAPSGGAVVTLSDNSSAATVPASVTVPAGATSTNFTVTTSSVTASTSATISAVFAGVTRTAVLTVTPASGGTLPAPSLLSPADDARFSPGQTILFDWSDVAGAASYTIEIDNSSPIAAPLVFTQTVTASQTSSSSLPTQRMWFRVRATDATGAAGAWSAVRRFEVKD